MDYQDYTSGQDAYQAVKILLAKGLDFDLEVLSGEGEEGTLEDFEGKISLRNLRKKLREERCGGDRWAKIRITSY